MDFRAVPFYNTGLALQSRRRSKLAYNVLLVSKPYMWGSMMALPYNTSLMRGPHLLANRRHGGIIHGYPPIGGMCRSFINTPCQCAASATHQLNGSSWDHGEKC